MAIYTAATPSQADFQSALSSGNTAGGDIIKLPPGTGLWGAGGSTTYITYPVTISGSGPGITVIQCTVDGPAGTNGIMNLFASGLTVCNLTINGSGSTTIFSMAGPNDFGGLYTADNFRLTNLVVNTNQDGSYLGYVNGAYGLIDNCIINSTIGSDELFFVRGRDNAWQTPSRCGSSSGVYIENCVFTGPGYVCDANSNAYVTVRFCTISGDMKVDGHGYASNTPRGVRAVEVYNNTWTTTDLTYAAQLRGGAGFSFNNTALNQNGSSLFYQLLDYGCTAQWPNFGVSISGVSTGNPGIITTQTPHGITGSWNVRISCASSTPAFTDDGDHFHVGSGIDAYRFAVSGVAVTASGLRNDGFIAFYQTPWNYPITDQIGVGQDPKRGGSQPFYLWNHHGTTGNWPLNWVSIPAGAVQLYQQQISNPNASFTMQSVISGGRDYFMQTVGTPFVGNADVGTGTLAQMNASTPTQSGVGFYAVDTGNWNSVYPQYNGTLFQWNGTNWYPYYTPFTYPHPLRGGSGISPVVTAYLRRLGFNPKFTVWSTY